MNKLFLLLIFIITSAFITQAQETAFSATENSEATELFSEANNTPEYKILSWNIQMLPRLLLPVRKGPLKRSKLIPQHIIKEDVDIIVFQELFDIRARRILKRKLKAEYPYKAGPANRVMPVFFTNSGIVIYSKYPITDKWRFAYNWREKSSHDKFSRKGCLMVEITLPDNQTIQVLGTHLQAGGRNSTTTRHSQYRQIKTFIDKHKKEGVPQLICGDFNTRKTDELNYKIMVNTIGADDGEISGDLCCTSDGLLNDMKSHNPEDRKVIDYIFYRGNGINYQYLNREVRQYRQRWHKNHQDLSDHNAVLGILKF